MEQGASTLDKYRARMYKPTSRKDLYYMLDDAVKIVTYDELNSFNSLDELLEPYQSVIILYPGETDPDVGHWVALFAIPGSDAT